MPELPTGTVTFLFTDIEGSTRLLARLGEDYAGVLAEHHRLLRQAIGARGGVEMGTEGDAFFVAFSSAGDAVAAAEAAQAALAATGVRVRMGLHTGEPLVTAEGYVGMDVHIVARICSAAHGGQVLLSRAVRERIGDSTTCRDLGEHRLKDVSDAVRLYQLGREDFPPPRTLRRTNLPVPPTPLVGRVEEVARVEALMRRDDVRLLTLTGPGGTGKTRLALEAAVGLVDEYEDGTFFVPLAPLSDPDHVGPEIARAVGIRGDLSEELEGRRLLLVLDNFEQVLPAGALVAQLLAAAPKLNILATSREPLHLAGEREYPVPPLPADDAAALFRERAYDAEPAEAVDAICSALDHFPLAIELAAARTKVLSPPELLERLDRDLSLLTGGPRDAPDRQRTLRGAIDWSYDLLADDETRLFRALGVFAGGFTLDAAEAVCDAELDTLSSLVDKSLVRSLPGRYSMLRTIREYALERLAEAGEDADARARHAGYFLDFAKERRQARSRDVLDALEVDNDNLRAARAWFRESGDVAAELELVRALVNFADVRGYWREAQEAAESALSRGDSAPPAIRAAGWQALAQSAYSAGDLGRARTAAEASLDLHRQVEDEAGARDALFMLGLVAAESGDSTLAAELTAETVPISERLGDQNLAAGAKANLGLYALVRGDTVEAKALTAAALEVFRRLGDDQGIVNTLENLGIAELEEGRLEEAQELLDESLERAQAVGFRTGTFNTLVALAALDAARAEAQRAAQLLATADALREQTGAAKLEALEARLYERTMAYLQGTLGREALASIWAECRELARDQAALKA